jgi:voltage-gated potassium channel
MLFLFDFIVRFFTSKSKGKYFFKQFGWADLLASIPITSFNIFRIFRVLRFVRIWRLMGGREMAKRVTNKPADIALYLVFFFILLLIEFGSIGVLVAEKGAPDANILTASEAIWWTFVSITTVGYGDYYPVTNAGRIVGVITLTVGVGLFGVVTGYLANAFLGKKS